MELSLKRGFGPSGVIFCAFFTFAGMACAGTYSGGTGTTKDPYRISTVADWQELIATTSDYDKHFILFNDIDFAGANLTPVAPDTNDESGFQGTAFMGVFNGNGHILLNADIDLFDYDYAGLFGSIGESGQVRNLGVKNIAVTGGGYVGGLVGWNQGSITSCYTTGVVDGAFYVGGLIGMNGNFDFPGSEITSCNSTCRVRGEDNVGGLLGSSAYSIVTSCYATGIVNAEYCSGGLIGTNAYSTVTSCYATGTVIGGWEWQEYFGGLIGYNTGGTIDTCYATGSVSGIGSIGGLLGVNEQGIITTCNASGSVIGSYGVGGLVGWNRNSEGMIRSSYATGSVSGHEIIGGLVGANEAMVNSCYANGMITGNRSVGGLAGTNSSAIISCNASGTIHSGDESDCVGGLCGLNRGGSITDSYAMGTVTSGIDSQNLGGLCGENGDGTITSCYATGAVSGTGSHVGGLCGWNNFDSGVITACYATGSAEGMEYVGGLTGWNSGTIQSCYATGTVDGQELIGGLSGNNSGTISSCYATGTASGSDYAIGGLVGWNYSGTITNSYATGIATGNDSVGGLCGWNYEGTISGCFWDIQTSGQSQGVGEGSGDVAGKTTAEMMAEATYTEAGWDFTDTWWMPCESYPRLLWEQDYSGGVGTSENPYRISTVSDWQDLIVNSADWDKNFILLNDIDFGGLDLLPVAMDFEFSDDFEGTRFSGVFDGKGHVLRNMNIDLGAKEVGVFGYIGNGAWVRNLGLDNITITADEDSDHVGGLCGFNCGGTISDCYTSGLVNRGSVSGGLVGYNWDGTINGCYTTCTVRGDCSGGLAGINRDGTIQGCFASGVISGGGTIGGLCGANLGTICSISDCYATGDVWGFQIGGGLCGYTNGGTIINCYSVGKVTSGHDPFYVGGFCGKDDPGDTISGCFWDIQTSGQTTSDGGDGKTTAEMKDLSTFVEADWDFVHSDGNPPVWKKPIEGYPRFIWEKTYSGGSGTAEDPYMISTVGDLITLGMNPGDYDKHFIMIADIDMGASTFTTAVIAPDTNITKISFQGTEFNGSFDGGNYSITGLTINTLADDDPTNDENDFLGLFGMIGTSGQIKNLGIENVTVASGVRSECIGGLCGINRGQITRCFVFGSIASGDYSMYLGGLCGINSDRGKIENCHSIGNMTSGRTSQHIGGLCGSNNGYIGNCYSMNNISGGLNLWEVGGLCGWNDGQIVNSCATGNVSGGDNSYYLGGLCGSNGDRVDGSYATGSVTGGHESKYLGGLCGTNHMGPILNCYAMGDITSGDNSKMLGGLCGESYEGTYEGSITTCYATGCITAGKGSEAIGGLCGTSTGAIRLCFWDAETSGMLTSAGGYSKTTSQMQDKATYIGWNNGAWTIDEGKDYPRLVWENKPGSGIDVSYPLRIYAGDGKRQPFEIATPDDLVCMSRRLEDWGKNFILVCDIDMAGVTDYWPIAEFSGRFDGDGYVIRNLTIDASMIGNHSELGLFGEGTSRCVIENLGLENIRIIGDDNSEELGCLCGDNRGSIDTCYVIGSITGGNGSTTIGILCGRNEGSIFNSHATGSVMSGDDSIYLGGLCGYNRGDIMNCFAAGNITGGNHSFYFGGLCGENFWGIIDRSYATGAIISGNESKYLSGFCGQNYDGEFDSCYATGTVSGGDRSEMLGGLCGSNYNGGTMNNCFSTGNVIAGKDSIRCGGLCGANSGLISNCLAMGSVTGQSNCSDLGGLCGWNVGGTIAMCYAIGNVTSGLPCGGLCGRNDRGAIDNCFWDIETSGQNESAGGTGLTTIEMKTLATFTDAGWDFVGEMANGAVDVWRMCWDGVSYPRLSWEFSRGGDMSCPDGVGMEDLAYLAGRWLAGTPATIGAADADRNGKVDMVDLAIVSENWMK